MIFGLHSLNIESCCYSLSAVQLTVISSSGKSSTVANVHNIIYQYNIIMYRHCVSIEDKSENVFDVL